MSLEYPSFSKLGRQAYLIIGGGPHMSICVVGAGGGRWSDIISALINPELYFQPASGERRRRRRRKRRRERRRRRRRRKMRRRKRRNGGITDSNM